MSKTPLKYLIDEIQSNDYHNVYIRNRIQMCLYEHKLFAKGICVVCCGVITILHTLLLFYGTTQSLIFTINITGSFFALLRLISDFIVPTQRFQFLFCLVLLIVNIIGTRQLPGIDKNSFEVLQSYYSIVLLLCYGIEGMGRVLLI